MADQAKPSSQMWQLSLVRSTVLVHLCHVSLIAGLWDTPSRPVLFMKAG